MYVVVRKLFALAAFVAFASALSPTGAAEPPKGAPPHPAPAPSAEPVAAGDTPDAVTQHSLAIDGRTVAYTARAGTIVLRNQAEQPTARMFYTAYTVAGDASARPVTFIYNGGPGSSTMWLRMGSFGPVRVLAGDGTPSGPPPYRIVDNQHSLLDKSDLVFVDMPDSGFGRILEAGKPKDFFGVDQDVAAFGQFIQNYITKFGRWNSPKFLFGESYGTPRSAALSDYLLQHGVALNGVVLLSSILSFGLDYGNGDPIAGGDWPYVFYLPSEAATAWYHNKLRNRPADLASYLSGVEHVALDEYASALAKGDKLAGPERDAVTRKLSEYLGLPEQFVRDANLRVNYSRFEKELMRPEGIVVGRLDSRYQTFETDRAGVEPRWDPTDSAIDAPYTTAINQYLRTDLKYDTPLTYRAGVYDIIHAAGDWDFSHKHRQPTNTAPDLADAMTQNPSLHVFSANGYYDFATPYFATVYTLKHLNLAPALQKNISYGFYQSGHMVYLSEPALTQFKRDLAGWYDAALAR
jgi:carboxypeptidase C (cathepsin A)